MYPANVHPLEPDRIAPILDPATPRWVRTLAVGATDTNGIARAFALTGAVLAPFAVGAALCLLGPPFLALGVTLLALASIALPAGAILVGRRFEPHVVQAPTYTFRGVPIERSALDMLADIQHRFLWARKMFGEVPTGIRWSEVEGQVDVLLWEAAEHAAKVSALDVELGKLVYAPPASPQGALRQELQRRRTALWASLEVTQREADDLAREASNTAAAARIALSRTGSVFDLEVVTPTGADLVARGTLAAARARLALLTQVWSELDETGAIADARFAGELGRGDSPTTS